MVSGGGPARSGLNNEELITAVQCGLCYDPWPPGKVLGSCLIQRPCGAEVIVQKARFSQRSIPISPLLSLELHPGGGSRLGLLLGRAHSHLLRTQDVK